MEATAATAAKQAPQCLGRDEVARRLGLSLRTTDTLILSGQIKSFKVGKKRLVTEEALSAYIRGREKVARQS
jgi:excisionase family DNA binding protein